MAYVSDIFNCAMALMDELSSEGEAQTVDTKDYKNRTPAIVNQMVAEHHMLTGEGGGWVAAEELEDFVDVEDAYAVGVMHYGLAAQLLVDENPSAANFYQQRYEEMRNIYVSRRQSEICAIENLYGINEMGRFARW